MACCLLMHLGHERSAADDIAFYNRERTRDGRGLTVPSQRRYVSYYERVLAGEAHSGDVRTLRAVQATNVGGNQSNLRLSFRQHEVGLMGDEQFVDLDLETAVGEASAQCEIRLEGDVLMAVADASSGNIIARCWLNVNMELRRHVTPSLTPRIPHSCTGAGST